MVLHNINEHEYTRYPRSIWCSIFLKSTFFSSYSRNASFISSASRRLLAIHRSMSSLFSSFNFWAVWSDMLSWISKETISSCKSYNTISTPALTVDQTSYNIPLGVSLWPYAHPLCHESCDLRPSSLVQARRYSGNLLLSLRATSTAQLLLFWRVFAAVHSIEVLLLNRFVVVN